MTPSEKMVEEIVRTLRRPVDAGILRREIVARNYAAACRALNEKFARAVANVRAGCYCEASRFANEERLFEEFQTLRFPEAVEWRKVCAKDGLDVAPDVMTDDVAELRLFTLDYEPARALFETNRRLALERAPLAARAKVLEKIARRFPEEQCWRDDLREFRKKIDD